MIRKHSLSSRVGAAVVVAMASIAPLSTAAAAPMHATPLEEPVVSVTISDINASNRKIAAAYEALITMWTNQFRQIGVRFVAPRIARYDQAVMSSCGVMQSDNAEYCARNNTIFYDEVFVAGMTKRAALALGTDGDMAGIGIIAHEMGHAVATQLGHEFRTSYENEATADCLAGAFARQADRDGSLEQGDVEEAFYGMSLAGDPTPELTGNVRLDARIARRIALQSHGTKEQRTDNFRAGLNGGPHACLSDLQG